jgi:hypothetical protein
LPQSSPPRYPRRSSADPGATMLLGSVEPCSQPERRPSWNFPPPPGSSGWRDVSVTRGWRHSGNRGPRP